MIARVMWATVLGSLLAVAGPARADDTKTKPPTVVVRLAAFDNLLADARFLAAQAGQEEAARQLEKTLQAMTGGKGIEGLDTKRPIGAYAILNANVVESEAVVLLPVADEKALIGFMENLPIKLEKGKDGIYTITSDMVPVPFYLTFANKYAYITGQSKGALDDKRRLDPTKLLAADQIGTFSLSFNLDGVPTEFKRIIEAQVETAAETAKDQSPPGETKTQKELRIKALDEVFGQFKALLNEGSDFTLRLTVDQKAKDVSAALSLSGQEGSSLAKNIAGLATMKSFGAGLVGKDSAMSLVVHGLLPETLRKVLDKAVDEAIKNAPQVPEEVAKVLAPTAKMGELDLAFDVRGPGAKGKYTGIAGVKVKEGLGIEKLFKEFLKSGQVPAEEVKRVTVDAEKVGTVNIHKIDVSDRLPPDSKELLGDGPIYFAVRDDALLFAGGENALEAIKEAVKAEPKTGKILQMQLSVARMAPLMAREQKAAPDAAKKAFGKEKDDDQVTITVEGGKSLQAKITVKAAVIKFVALVSEAAKK
jgi:hypothetical protein